MLHQHFLQNCEFVIERNGMRLVMQWHRTVDRQLAGSSRHVQLVSCLSSLQLSGAHLLFANGGCSQSAGRTRGTAVWSSALCVYVRAHPPYPTSPLPYPTSEFIFTFQRKEGRTILAFHFPVQGFPVFFVFFPLQINALQSTLTDVTLHHFHDDT